MDKENGRMMSLLKLYKSLIMKHLKNIFSLRQIPLCNIFSLVFVVFCKWCLFPADKIKRVLEYELGYF